MKRLLAIILLATAVLLPWRAEAQRLTDEQLRMIESQYVLDRYMAVGCAVGLAIGLASSALLAVGVAPVAPSYLALGCSAGFLAAATLFFVKDWLTYEPVYSPMRTRPPGWSL
ncbi:MAG: hypothetical protein OHK0024_14960 [Thalassobaculales bacterium]